MFDVTTFYSPGGVPEGCRVKVDEHELDVVVGQSSLTVRGRRLIRRPEPVEFADVLEVRVGRGERSALRGATRALELVIRDRAGETEVWRPITREAPDAAVGAEPSPAVVESGVA